MTATEPRAVVTLTALADALVSDVDGLGVITDNTTYSKEHTRRAITVTSQSTAVGTLVEYPTDQTKFMFTPNGAVAYAILNPVVELFKKLGVGIDVPRSELDDLPF